MKLEVVNVFNSSMALTMAALFSLSTPASGADTGLTVQFIARSTQLPVDGHNTSPFGHAYIIMGVKTNVGTKEEVFGFYARGENGLKSEIKGPGMLRSEMRCGTNDDCSNPKLINELKRLSESTASVTVPITSDQRAAIFKEINKWNAKDYDYTDQNCIDFVAAVVKDIGYPVPAVYLHTPTEFIKALQVSVEQENKVRAARASAEAAKQKQIEAEEAALAAEQRQKAAEQAAKIAEENYIPPGWIPCRCPAAHARFGKYVNGILYHPESVGFCPKGSY